MWDSIYDSKFYFHNIVMYPKRSAVLGPSSHHIRKFPYLDKTFKFSFFLSVYPKATQNNIRQNILHSTTGEDDSRIQWEEWTWNYHATAMFMLIKKNVLDFIPHKYLLLYIAKLVKGTKIINSYLIDIILIVPQVWISAWTW